MIRQAAQIRRIDWRGGIGGRKTPRIARSRRRGNPHVIDKAGVRPDASAPPEGGGGASLFTTSLFGCVIARQ